MSDGRFSCYFPGPCWGEHKPRQRDGCGNGANGTTMCAYHYGLQQQLYAVDRDIRGHSSGHTWDAEGRLIHLFTDWADGGIRTQRYADTLELA